MWTDNALGRAYKAVAEVRGIHLDTLPRIQCEIAGNIGDERRTKIRRVLEAAVNMDPELKKLQNEIDQLAAAGPNKERLTMILLKRAQLVWVLLQNHRGPIWTILFDCQQDEHAAGIHKNLPTGVPVGHADENITLDSIDGKDPSAEAASAA